MAAVEPCNVIQVVLATPFHRDLASAERFFIRKLQPVFNIRELDDSIVFLSRTLTAVVSDDAVTMGNRILRQARPRLSPSQRASLIAEVGSVGDRALAAKLARHARRESAQHRTAGQKPETQEY